MPKFRLTTGENGTAWGKQTVLFTADAANAIEFCERAIPEHAKHFSSKLDLDYSACVKQLKNVCWVDAGENTIPVAVQSLIFYC